MYKDGQERCSAPVSCWKMGIQMAVISSGMYLREKIVRQGFFT